MALKLKPTPILSGAPADRFLKIIKQNETQKVSVSERESIIDFAQKILKKSNL